MVTFASVELDSTREVVAIKLSSISFAGLVVRSYSVLQNIAMFDAYVLRILAYC